MEKIRKGKSPWFLDYLQMQQAWGPLGFPMLVSILSVCLNPWETFTDNILE